MDIDRGFFSVQIGIWNSSLCDGNKLLRCTFIPCPTQKKCGGPAEISSDKHHCSAEKDRGEALSQ